MKTKIFLLSVLFSSATFFTFAQDSEGKKQRKRTFNIEKMQSRANNAKAAKAIFVVSKANLTETELQQFLPLYQEYQTKIRENRRASRQAIKEARKNETTIDYAKVNSDFVNMKAKEVEILKEYNTKLSQVLPAEKVWKVLKADQQFKQKTMRKGGKKMAAYRGHRHKNCQHQP